MNREQFSDKELRESHDELKSRLRRDLDELTQKEARMPMFDHKARKQAQYEIAALRKSLASISKSPLPQSVIYSPEGKAGRLDKTPNQINELVNEKARIRAEIRKAQNPGFFEKIKGWFSKENRVQDLERQLAAVQRKLSLVLEDQGTLAVKYGTDVLHGSVGEIGDMEEIHEDPNGTAEDVDYISSEDSANQELTGVR